MLKPSDWSYWIEMDAWVDDPKVIPEAGIQERLRTSPMA